MSGFLGFLWNILCGIGWIFWQLGRGLYWFGDWFYNRATAVQRLVVIIVGLTLLAAVITLVLWHIASERQKLIDELNTNANIANRMGNVNRIEANINKLEGNQNALGVESNRLANEQKNIAVTEANKFDGNKANDHYCRRYCMENVCVDWRNAHPELQCTEAGAKPK